MWISILSTLGIPVLVAALAYLVLRYVRREAQQDYVIEKQQAEKGRLEKLAEKLSRIKRRQRETDTLIPDSWDDVERVRREKGKVRIRTDSDSNDGV